jgi:ABC-type phosphate transport system substrate-binding protein
MKISAFQCLLLGLLFGLLVVAATLPAAAAEGYTVIVHSSNPATSLSREQVARYFLKKATSWPSGKTVAAVDQDKDAAVRQAFSKDVLKKRVVEINAYWQRQIFSGLAVPPVEKAGDAAVLAFVEGNEGAIGYVSGGANTGGAKVVNVVD